MASVAERAVPSETRIVPCARCNGDGGWSVPVGIDYRDGSLIEREERCEACGGTGEEEVEVEPVTEEEMMACPVCGNEERGQGGYLTCQCPAISTAASGMEAGGRDAQRLGAEPESPAPAAAGETPE